MTRFEWRKRVDFAEFAEALGVTTEEIVCAMMQQESRAIVVLYSPGVSSEADELDLTLPMYRALLTRDDDGVIAVVKIEQAGTVADLAVGLL